MKHAYLTLVAIIRNQEHYVREWLAHHRSVGFERFVIALHKCTDGTEKAIHSMPFSKDVFIYKYEDEQYVQMRAYSEMCGRFRNSTEWIAVLDSDEYLFGVQESDLKVFLREYEDYGALLVHNHEFGSSNHVLRPQNISIEAFVYRAHDDHWMHKQIKSIFRTKYYEWFHSPHCIQTSKDMAREDHSIITVDHIHSKCEIKTYKPVFSKIRYNHYHVRSMEDWIERHKHGSVCGPRFLDREDVKCFKARDHADQIDLTIQKYTAGIKSILAKIQIE